MSILKTIAFGLCLSAALFAGVECKQSDQTTANGTWTLTALGTGWTGTCVGVSRPAYYVVTAASYGIPFDTAAFDRDMQAVFNDAHLGDFVLYKAGDVFVHGSDGGPRITRRSGTGVLTVTTTEYAKLPASGTRITLAYTPLMPWLQQRGGTFSNDYSYSFFSLVGLPGSGDHGSADHIVFRGLHFSYTSPTKDTYIGYFELGYCPINIGSGGRFGASGRAYATTITATPAVNGTNKTIAVLDTHAFAVTMPRQQIVFGSFPAAGDLYTVAGVDDTAHTITVNRPLTAAASYYKIYPVLNRNGDSQYQPDDITVQQCVFNNPIPRINANGYIAANSRALTVRDNWFQLSSNQGGQEPKIMAAGSAYGPHLVENNYFWGGMAFMYGGQPNATNASVAGGGMWRYNLFSLPNEYTNVSTWYYAFNDPPDTFNADMSVAGLPPNSPRFVIAGRSLDAPSASSGFHYWTALNSGVVGTTRPTCFATGTVSVTVRGSRCYDGDSTRPGTTECADGVGSSTKPGDGVCWQLNYSGLNAVKNAWETKSSSHQTLQYNVFNGYPTIIRYNTAQSAVINVKIASYYFNHKIDHPEMDADHTARYHSPGCRWYTADPLIPTTAKVFAAGDYSGVVYNPTMAAYWAAYGGYNQWPECSRAFGDHIAIKNNWMRNVWGGVQFYGYYSSSNHRGATSGDWEFSGNLVQMRGFGAVTPAGSIYAQVYSHRCLSLGANASDEHDDEPSKVPLANVNISFNTCYMPFSTPIGTMGSAYAPIGLPGQFSKPYEGESWNVFSGQRKMVGNVIGRSATGIFVSNTSAWDSRGFGEGENIAQLWPGTQRDIGGIYGVWGKNIMLGSPGKDPGGNMMYSLGPYPNMADGSPSVWTGCGSTLTDAANYTNTTPCYGGAVGASAPPDYAKVFVNPKGGDFRLRDDHPFKRAQDGADVGADPEQLPMIKGLTVTPTDRSVLFTWDLTPPIQHIPCVVELHTAPDLETTNWAGTTTGFQAELTTLLPATAQNTIQDSAGNNIDSDAHDRNYRDGTRRMIVLGHTVNLRPNTPYYYRLHCGGDALVGMFTTLPALSSTATQTIARTAVGTNTASMLVEYGTSYSRATDTINGGGTASASCTVGNPCVVTFSATRGTVVYYRWKELSSGDLPVLTGNVDIMPVL